MGFPTLAWTVVGVVVGIIGCVLIAQRWLDAQRAAFETDARIVHRLLSQQVVQHDAVLATLALLQPGAAGTAQRLTSIYPRLLSVQRRDPGQGWPDPAIERAEAASLLARRAAMVEAPLSLGRYTLVLAGDPASHALTISLDGLVPQVDWPMDRTTSPVRVALRWRGEEHVIQAGKAASTGWRFDFDKVVAAESQPFHAVATRWVAWNELPWWPMTGWVLATGLLLAALRHALRQREQRERAEALLRLDQLGRLNAMGELAAGMAHELNQPLTAVLANTQAAQRLLADDPPALDTAQHALDQAAAQARRAADVVGRLRRSLDQSATPAAARAVDLAACARSALHLLAPDTQRLSVQVSAAPDRSTVVRADPVALDQIVHNLLLNALQAMDTPSVSRRQLAVSVGTEGAQGWLSVSDTGPGLPQDVLPRVFEPFFSTREGGLGLGLSLSESLAQGMGGRLMAENLPAGGAQFTLWLPLDKD